MFFFFNLTERIYLLTTNLFYFLVHNVFWFIRKALATCLFICFEKSFCVLLKNRKKLDWLYSKLIKFIIWPFVIIAIIHICFVNIKKFIFFPQLAARREGRSWICLQQTCVFYTRVDNTRIRSKHGQRWEQRN